MAAAAAAAAQLTSLSYASAPASPLGSRRISFEPSRFFYPVGGKHLEKFAVLTDIFQRILVPLYGPQDKALEQIKQSKDRRCFLLYDEEQPVGVLQFKTVLSDEYKEFGITDSVEIKSLFVYNAGQNSGKGLGSCLIDKLKEEVEALDLGHKGIHVTVSETKEESLLFFKKKGFEIVHSWRDRYQKGVTEYLLCCPARISSLAAAQASVETDVPELFHVIHDAHLDDIHSLTRLSDGTFVSGSKDNCLYKWSPEGTLMKIVDEVEPTTQSEKNWITAVTTLTDDYWISGDRSGRVFLWKTSGHFVREIMLKKPKRGDHVSLRENSQRVNCLVGGLSRSHPSFYVGFPTLFDEFNMFEGRTVTSTKVHPNDWVYCIHPFSDTSLATVVGCTIDVWNRTDTGWSKTDTLIHEGPKIKVDAGGRTKWQRPFIASFAPIDSSNHFGIAMFDGSVRALDASSKTILKTWNEHKHRVWQIEKIFEGVFASSGEDQTIRVWDLRQSDSVKKIVDPVGQVTSLLNLKEHVLLSGSCPEKPLRGKKSAQIRFYDLRK